MLLHPLPRLRNRSTGENRSHITLRMNFKDRIESK